MVGGCVLTSDGPALPPTDFCSCPASADNQQELLQRTRTGKELFHWDSFDLSWPLSIKLWGPLLVHQRVGGGCGLLCWPGLELSDSLRCPDCLYPSAIFRTCHMLFGSCSYHILCLHYAKSWDLTWILHATRILLLLYSSWYRSCCNHLCLRPHFQRNAVICNALKLG